ncbi:MAG: hypothetical protein FWC50_13020 [Planctomycetaceae bacterium]|nr:hypothetical protein [Planctomycetaceae bacterium]
MIGQCVVFQPKICCKWDFIHYDEILRFEKKMAFWGILIELMMIRTTIIFILLLVFSTMPCQAVDSSDNRPNNWPEHETTHFVLRMEPTPYQIQAVSLREWGEMLEQFFGQLESQIRPVLTDQHDSVFRKPTLFLCATPSSYQALLADHGLAPNAEMAGSGGFYDKPDNTIFLFLQQTSYYTQHVVLHETTHWYCHRILGERYDRLPLWLAEGLADHCAFHTWDGKRLQAIHLPRVSLENYPERFQAFLRQFVSAEMETEISPASIDELVRQGSQKTSLQPALVNTCPVNHDVYAIFWGVTSFLLERYPAELKRFIADCPDRDDHASRQWTFSWIKPPEWHDLATWAETKQLPWEWIWNRWEDDGKALTGISDTTALMVKRFPASISANGNEPLHLQAKPLLPGTVFGIVLNYENSSRFEAIQWRDLTATTVSWRHVRYIGKKWESLTPWQEIAFTNAVNNMPGTPENEPALEISVPVSKNSELLSVECNGALILQLPRRKNFDSGSLVTGLLVQTGAAQFILK